MNALPALLFLCAAGATAVSDAEEQPAVHRVADEAQQVISTCAYLQSEQAESPVTSSTPATTSSPQSIEVHKLPEPPVRVAGVTSPPAKSPAWTLGDFTVKPYGAFWTDMIYATNQTSTGPFTVFVFSSQDQGSPQFIVDSRRSRFGLDVDGPRIDRWGADTRGRVEIDFFGEFVNENQANLLLRHAYWEAENDHFRFLVGQTWDVISPLNPGALNYSVGWGGGNIGFRRAQFRAERYFTPTDRQRWELQVSLNQDIVTDFAATPGVRREAASWPIVEARLGWQRKRPKGGPGPVQLGVSGHIGETGFDFLTDSPPPMNLPPENDARFRSWSFNADVKFPITKRLGVQSEFFMGSNLSPYFGGIVQGVCPCSRKSIGSIGGWLDIRYQLSRRWSTNWGYGQDDPRNNDFLFGRTYNQFLFSNVVLNVTERLISGIEVTYWRTLYQDLRVGQIPDDELAPTAPGESVVIQWMVKYSF